MSALPWDWSFAWSIVPVLLSGLKITVIATIPASALSFALGLVWTVVRYMRVPVLSVVVSFCVEFLRGTPFLVQLYVLFYVLPGWGVSLSALVTGIVGLGVLNSAYSAEIYRAGIEDIPPGQWEAALTLGLPLPRVWLGIILPQAIRTVLPVFGNQVIAMFKETAVLSSITVLELLAQARSIGSIEFRYVEPLTLAGLMYVLVSYPATRLIRRLEMRHAV
jgi:polar amino acid transport system permease protein